MSLDRFRFQSFKTRILVFFLGLLIVVQGGIFLSVNSANIKNARAQINGALKVTAGVFARLVKERDQRLLEAARLLSGDFAFKQAYSTRDHSTILSALDNHRQRITADVMMLVSIEGKVISDTLHPDSTGSDFALPELIEAAEESEYGEAARITFIDGRPYQMVVVPLLVPMPDAWIFIGFFIDDRFVQELQRLTQTHVSLVKSGDGASPVVLASTLDPVLRKWVSTAAPKTTLVPNQGLSMNLGGDEYVSFIVPLVEGQGGIRVTAVLQRSLDEALGPFKRLRIALATLFAAGLSLSIIGGILIARTVTRPVETLVAGVRKVSEGDYGSPVDIRQRDEIGHLADAFNSMTKGLAERDRVRGLLGKVVSPAIAEELLSKEIELGGEEREVTILFSDIRGFTTLCERFNAHEILSLLNAYFTKISSVIEGNGGVVDKYIGDAVMALFGAPLRRDNDAERAVRTGLGMCMALGELNSDFEARGMPRLDIGIGINTAKVVAGNMGSSSRLNYTVVGDGVNLASRIEGLSKVYGVRIVVSGATASLSPGFTYRELDMVRVKGKTEPVAIYEPIGERGAIRGEDMAVLRQYNEALRLYRGREWHEAGELFKALRSKTQSRLYDLYLERISSLIGNPPQGDWDPTTVFYEK